LAIPSWARAADDPVIRAATAIMITFQVTFSVSFPSPSRTILFAARSWITPIPAIGDALPQWPHRAWTFRLKLDQLHDPVAVALARAASRIEPITSARVKRCVIAALVIGAAESCVGLRQCRRDLREGSGRDRDHGPSWTATADIDNLPNVCFTIFPGRTGSLHIPAALRPTAQTRGPRLGRFSFGLSTNPIAGLSEWARFGKKLPSPQKPATKRPSKGIFHPIPSRPANCGIDRIPGPTLFGFEQERPGSPAVNCRLFRLPALARSQPSRG
jgi:hypothetical protein